MSTRPTQEERAELQRAGWSVREKWDGGDCYYAPFFRGTDLGSRYPFPNGAWRCIADLTPDHRLAIARAANRQLASMIEAWLADDTRDDELVGPLLDRLLRDNPLST